MLPLSIFSTQTLTLLEKEITRHVNKNLSEILRVSLDFIEDNNDFNAKDFLYNSRTELTNSNCEKVLYDLYDMVSSNTIRDYIKPIYQYMLYSILIWWEESQITDNPLLLIELDNNLIEKINEHYSDNQNEKKYILKSITSLKKYKDLLFDDYDFLPDALEEYVLLYLTNSEAFDVFFPDIDLSAYQELMPNDLRERFKEHNSILNKANNKSYETTLLNDLLFCCISAQGYMHLAEANENKINDYIRNILLGMKKYDLCDQTRQGKSPNGKDAGEIDILFRRNQLPFSIVESLILKSLDTSYLSTHINKIFSYDTRGNEYNFIISFVHTKNFEEFWNKYYKYISSYNFPYPLKNTEHKNTPTCGSESRIAVSTLNREGSLTKLYHIIVHMQL